MSTNHAAIGAAPPVAGIRAFADSPTLHWTMSLIGRIGIAHLFCRAALFHLTNGWELTINNMKAEHIPMPEVLNVVAMVVSAGLALALLFNFKARWAALGLALYTLVVSSVMYTPGPGVAPQVFVLFMKDMAIFGGLIALSAALAVNARLQAELDSARR